MKNILLLVLTLLFCSQSFAQKTEIKVVVNSGLFSFTGPSAESSTFINYSDRSSLGHTNNPYGSGNGLSIGLSGRIQRVSKKHFLTGIDLGYEHLASKTSIKQISIYDGTSSYYYAAKGHTFLNYQFINANPYIGYRFQAGAVSLDLTGGFEIAYCLTAHEKGTAKDEHGKDYTTSLDRKTIKTDVRPRGQLSANYGRTGIYIGYSYGLANYKSGYVGGVTQCYARMARFGLTYRFN
jgi:hypothetical protein